MTHERVDATPVAVPPRTVRRRLRSAAVYAAYRLGGAGISVLPEPVSALLASLVGTALVRRPHSDLAMRERHVARVLEWSSPVVPPDPGVVHRWAVRSYRSYARYWVEGARLPAASPDEIAGRLVLDWGFRHLAEAFETGRGVLLALPHLGTWEWGGAYLALEGHPMTSIAERVEPARLFDWFVERRAAMGLRVVPLGDDAGTQALRVLRDGGLVGLVSDRDINGNGIEVEFFGEKTTLPAGPATLALRTGAVLLPGAVYNGPRASHYGVVTPPVDTTRTGSFRQDVARVTQELARCFERIISRAPEQWHIYQPNWPSDRSG